MPFTESECIAQATGGTLVASELRENLRGDCALREICDRKDQGAGIVRPLLERDCAIRELEVVSDAALFNPPTCLVVEEENAFCMRVYSICPCSAQRLWIGFLVSLMMVEASWALSNCVFLGCRRRWMARQEWKVERPQTFVAGSSTVKELASDETWL